MNIGSRESGEVDDAAWSTQDVPVRSDPLEFNWSERGHADDEPIEFSEPRIEGVESRSISGDKGRSNGARLARWIVPSALALVAVVVVGRLGDSDDPAAGPTGTESTTGEVSPSVLPPVDLADGDGDGGARADDGVDAAAVTEVALPPAVAIQSPTEIVMLNDEGLIATLSLPSGAVRAVHVGVDEYAGFASELVVSPTAMAMSVGNSGVVVVPRAGPPVVVEPDALVDGTYVAGWHRGVGGESLFTVVAYGRNGGDPGQYIVDESGAVAAFDQPRASGYGFELTTDDGERIVNDAGGAYEIAADGTSRRIEDGEVYAASGDHRLVRQCDEAFVCGFELVTVSSGERQPLDPALLPADFENVIAGATLSPDGSAVAIRRNEEVSERSLVVFGAGETATSSIGGWSQGAAWDADGSGVFDVPVGGEGIQYTSRDGGEAVIFGEELGRILAIGTRWPESEIEVARTVVAREFTPPLSSTGLTLMALARVGGMSYVDVDAGLAQTWETTVRLGRGSSTLLPRDDGEVVLPDAESESFVTNPAGERVLAEIFTVRGAKLPGPTDDTVWIPSADFADAGTSPYVLVPLDATDLGEATARVNMVDADLLGSDGRGGLVIERGGDVFVMAASTSERLTSGELLAINADTAYVRECDAVAACGFYSIDRSIGSRSPVAAEFGADVGFDAAQAGRGSPLATSVSPSGDVILVRLPLITVGSDGSRSVDDTWAFADTVDGRVTFIDDLDARQPVVWAPDSEFAAVLSGSALHVYDRSAAAMVPVGLGPLVAIGPAPGSVEDLLSPT